MFIHGKKDGIDKLIEGFIETIKNEVVPPKAQIKKKILEIAERKKAGEPINVNSNNESKSTQGLYGTPRWIVHNDIITKLNLEVFYL